MPYDPQRSHRRPRLAEDAPAPIDALLREEGEPEPAPAGRTGPAAAPEAERRPAAPAVIEPPAVSDEPPPFPPRLPDVEPPAPTPGRARPLVLAATLVLLVLLALAWLRRRR